MVQQQETTGTTGAAAVNVGAIDVDSRFSVARLNAEGRAAAQELETRFKDLLQWVATVGVESRALSMAATHLEEASFWAKKAIATNLKNQEH